MRKPTAPAEGDPRLDPEGGSGGSGDRPPSMTDLTFEPAHELATLIRDRRVSAAEVLEAHLANIARHNPALNAIVTLDERGARRRAREADAALARGEVWGPLHGVPVTIKDALETAGLRTTAGHPPLASYVPERDATVVARLRAGGAIVLGKTNLPPLAAGFQTDGPLLGRANNPWDTSRTPGGSTGGGAAAVAAGLSPLEMGSDFGGSIRIPAHFCGVFGLKPTEHRVSTAGHIPETPGTGRRVRHMAAVGPLARSIEDLRLCLSLIEGPDGRNLEVPPAPRDDAPARPLGDYRIAWTDGFGGVTVSAEIRAALERLAGQLEEAGCRVERCDPAGFDVEALERAGRAVGGFEARPELPRPIRLLVRLQTMATAGDAYIRGLNRRDALTARLEEFLSDWDTWLCPAAAVPAFTHRKPGGKIEMDGQKVAYWAAGSHYTKIFTFTGNPVVALPIARSSDGLPIGAQLVGRRWHDNELLNVAAAIAEVTGGFNRPPGYA
jgi:amidase